MDQHGFVPTDNRCMYSSAYPYSRLCGGLSGLLGSGGGEGNLFSGIYGELDSGKGGGGCVLGGSDLTNTFLGTGEKGNFLSESRELSPNPQTR